MWFVFHSYIDNFFTGEAAGNETCVACPAGSHAAGKLITTTWLHQPCLISSIMIFCVNDPVFTCKHAFQPHSMHALYTLDDNSWWIMTTHTYTDSDLCNCTLCECPRTDPHCNCAGYCESNSSCTVCEPGYHASRNASTACQECPLGTYSGYVTFLYW